MMYFFPKTVFKNASLSHRGVVFSGLNTITGDSPCSSPGIDIYVLFMVIP